MPELPEVEVVRAGLEKFVVGRTVERAQVLHPRAVRRDPGGPAGFADAMAGRLLSSAERRGKYLWLDIGGEALLAHLGMSGQLLVTDPERPLSPHVRVRFTFTDSGPDLRFTDQRTFGHLAVAEFAHVEVRAGHTESIAGRPAVTGDAADWPTVDGAAIEGAAVDGAAVEGRSGRVRLPAPIAHIAPDPFEPAFDPAAFAARLTRRKTGVKRALLDQSLISGIGNIYADEALWRSRLHWARPTEALTRAQVSDLLGSIRDVLGEALRAGGTTFDSLYVNVNGESGYFERSLAAYGREGEPCPRCGTPIRRDAFMNRSAFSCPHCQPRPRRGRW